MAAGLTTITVLDGNGAPKTVQVWSSNGLASGILTWLHVLAGADDTNPVSATNPLLSAALPYQITALGVVRLTPLVAATTLATIAGGSIPVGATFAQIQAENVDLRYRDDAAAPTAALGFILRTGPPVVIAGNLANYQFIQTAAGGAINVGFYK